MHVDMNQTNFCVILPWFICDTKITNCHKISKHDLSTQ